MRPFALALLLLAGCAQEKSYETITAHGHEFRIVSQEELPHHRGGCALKVTYLTENDALGDVREEDGQLIDGFMRNRQVVYCGHILVQADHPMKRLGGLFIQTSHVQMNFDRDASNNWRRAVSD